MLASRRTDAPMRFATFKQERDDASGELAPPTPAVLIACTADGASVGAAFYRDPEMRLRSPTMCAAEFALQQAMLAPLFRELKERWDGARLARPVFADDDGVRSNDELLLGAESYASAKPGESIYPASCGLDVERYVPLDEAASDPKQRALPKPESSVPAFVQYAPRAAEDAAGCEADHRAFFGGGNLAATS